MWKTCETINAKIQLGINVSDYIYSLTLCEIGIWIYGVMMILICLYISRDEIIDVIKKLSRNEKK